MQLRARKASFLLEECTLLVLDPNKKRSLTKCHGQLTHELSQGNTGQYMVSGRFFAVRFFRIPF